eukprot:8213404-Alexandrium_andersonii.AAC.1
MSWRAPRKPAISWLDARMALTRAKTCPSMSKKLLMVAVFAGRSRSRSWRACCVNSLRGSSTQSACASGLSFTASWS